MGGGLTNLWAILLKQETYRRPLKLSSFLMSFCYSAVMDVFLLSCNYLFSLCECGIWPKVSLQFCFSLFQFWIFGERKSTWPERLKYNDYRFMYRQIPFSCNHLQTTVDVMFPTETSLNDFFFFFSVWRYQESNSVLCISGPFTEQIDVGLCFFYMWGLFCRWNTRDLHLRAERIWWFFCLGYNFSCFTLPLYMKPHGCRRWRCQPVPETFSTLLYSSLLSCTVVERMCCTYRWVIL